MALIASSSEMSFSASRLLRTLRSMSTYVLLACLLLETAELDLNPAGAELGIAVLAGRAVLLQDDARLARAGDPSEDAVAAVRARRENQPADVAAPVPRQRQRPVHSRRRNFERVRIVAHPVSVIEPDRELPAGEGYVVQAYTAIGVDSHAQHLAAARRGDPDALQVHIQRVHDGLQQPGQPGRVRRRASKPDSLALAVGLAGSRTAAGATVHDDLLPAEPRELMLFRALPSSLARCAP